MPYLVAAIALVGALCLIDLVLSLGVVRRLRQHTDLLASLLKTSPPSILAPGRTVGAFTAVTDEGEIVSKETLSGRTLVGFFVEGCAGCTDAVPDFAAAAARFPGGRDQVLAVIVLTDEQYVAGYRTQLAPVARVVVERRSGALSTAMDVSGFPVFGLLDEAGQVLLSGMDLPRIAEPAGV